VRESKKDKTDKGFKKKFKEAGYKGADDGYEDTTPKYQKKNDEIQVIHPVKEQKSWKDGNKRTDS